MATVTAARVDASGGMAPGSDAAAARTAGPGTANLSTAQTGTGASTNIVDRGGQVGPAALVITTTVGGGPSCTYAIEGSPNGTNWAPCLYADSSTPATVVATTFAISSATTVIKVVQPNQPYRYLRITYSANTNVTNTLDAYVW